jgi:division/cell wall cluster transcriptional repressor MraZ
MEFRGDYECTMDEKGRIKMPSVLRKQFAASKENRFVLVKDLEDCLVIYPMNTWNELEARLRKLNPFNLNHQRFINLVTNGWTEVEIEIQVWDLNKHQQYAQLNVANSEHLAADAAAYLDGIEIDKK